MHHESVTTTLERRSHYLGIVLVALQFGLITLLAGTAWPAFRSGEVPPGAWITAALGALLGIWALSTNKPGNFNIRPNPKKGARLVQRGPYKWIRHPMYTAVIACGWGGAWAGASRGAWLVLVVLMVVLIIKAVIEERWMLVTHPSYAPYRKGTWWFLPWLI